MAIKAKSITVGLPWGLGSVEFEANEAERRAAWALYVELMTRAAVQPFHPEWGSLREVLTSLYSLFELTRRVLREAGPAVAHGPQSFGPVAIEALTQGIAPFTTRWHPCLRAYEAARPEGVDALQYEKAWEHYTAMRRELEELRKQMRDYADILAKIAGAKGV